MKKQLKLSLNIVIVCLLLCGLSFAQEKEKEKPEKTAQKVAEAWMPIWDAGKYDESYEELSESVKKKIDKKMWFIYWSAIRKPLGKLKSRSLVKAEFIKSLPGLPDQEGVVLEYKSSFETKEEVVETFGLIHEKDDSWRVGYYLTNQE